VCPVKAVKLDDIDTGFGLGTAYIDAREQACDFSCDGLQCVLACPTGSLTHDLDYTHDTRMGFAVLDKPKICLAVESKALLVSFIASTFLVFFPTLFLHHEYEHAHFQHLLFLLYANS